VDQSHLIAPDQAAHRAERDNIAARINLTDQRQPNDRHVWITQLTF